MPRGKRCLLPDFPCHITQRGVNRCDTFSTPGDRETFLALLADNLADTGVRLLGLCLMTNHIHLIAVPERDDSISVLMRRVTGGYAQYYNARTRRTGHLWQNRFFSCVLGGGHLWAALAYVDLNPVRAGIVSGAAEYPWSSALAHVTRNDQSGLLDMEWWKREAPESWELFLREQDDEIVQQLGACTHSGRPFGDDEFVKEMGERLGRTWVRGRPSKSKRISGGEQQKEQFSLW